MKMLKLFRLAVVVCLLGGSFMLWQTPAVVNAAEPSDAPITRPAPTVTPQEFCPPNSKDPVCTGENSCKDFSDCALINTINDFLTVMGWIIPPVATIFAILGGVQYAAANGNPQKIQEAKDRIYKALAAIIAFGFMWSFLQWLVPGGLF